VFILPTQQENYGFALIEAMACGIHVITTAEVDIAHDIKSAGVSICPRDPPAFAEQIK